MVYEHCRAELHNLIVGDAVDIERVLRYDGVHCCMIGSFHHNHSANARRLRTGSVADERSAEALSDMLMDAGALSATIEDADAESTDEKPLYGEPGLEPDNCAWPRSIVSILADDDFDLETSLAIAVKALKCEKPELLGTEEVEDADWVRITQAQFQPTQVSDRLWIVPTWHDLPNEDAINVRLDPGVAFGTGSHPTTHLCLQWLDANVKATDRVLDYGCGTGILAIAAKLVGAAEVAGTDIDPQAVEAAGDRLFGKTR